MTPRPSPDGKSLGVHPPRAARQPALREGPRHRRRHARLRQARQGPAGSVDGARRLPAVRWTPDSRRIVIWGQGKIWKVDVAAKTGRRDPVHGARAADDHDGGRVPGDGAPGPVPGPACCATCTVSPDGSQVAFSALGRVYVRAHRPGGEPQRADDRRARSVGRCDRARSGVVARTAGRFVFTTWHDSRLGRVVVADASAGVGARDRERRRATTSSRRSRPTAAGSRTARRAATACATIDGSARARSLHRGGRRVVAAAAGAREAAPSRVRSHRHAPVLPRAARAVRAGERRISTAATRVVHVAVRRMPPTSCRRPTASGWRSTSAGSVFVTPFARTGRPVDIGPRATGLPGRADFARRRVLPALVGRQPPRALGARAGAVHARSARTFAFLGGGIEPAPTSRSRRACRSGSRRKADVPTGVDGARPARG